MDEKLRFTLAEVQQMFEAAAVPMLNDLVYQNAVTPLLLLYYLLLKNLHKSEAVDLHTLATDLERCAKDEQADAGVQALCEAVAAYVRGLSAEPSQAISPADAVRTARKLSLKLVYDADNPLLSP